MTTKTILTQDLTGAALDWAVAKCEGLEQFYATSNNPLAFKLKVFGWKPSCDWSQGGPIIEREKLMIQPKLEKGDWYGTWRGVCLSWEGRTHSDVTGATALVAAMRCYVAAKLGHQVEVPEELAP